MKRDASEKTRFHNIGEESSATCVASVGVTPDGEVFPVRCKRWSCSVCAPINAYRAAIKTANGVYALYAAGVRPKFVTITQSGAVKTPEFAYSILSSQWDKFRNRWQYWARKTGLPNYYAAFVEGQSRREGMPHFHIIGAAIPPIALLRDYVVSSGFGYKVDRQELKPNAGVAWYVSKYSTKGSEAHLMPKGFRRVRYSEDWPDMLFRSDMLESEAIVKERGESYSHWLLRAVAAFKVDPSEVMEKTQALVDGAQNEVLSEYAAQALVMVNSW